MTSRQGAGQRAHDARKRNRLDAVKEIVKVFDINKSMKEVKDDN